MAAGDGGHSMKAKGYARFRWNWADKRFVFTAFSHGFGGAMPSGDVIGPRWETTHVSYVMIKPVLWSFAFTCAIIYSLNSKV
jgi:hypothetical protein